MASYIKDYVEVNKYTRPDLKLLGVKGIVIHWTATPNASAKNERNYFNGTCIAEERYASAHIFVDRKEARLIIPLDEVAYHANDKPSKISKFKATTSYYKGGNANLTTLGVEMCVEKNGTIHADTIARAEKVVAELCKQYKLTEKDIYRHYDITGKNCPAPFVSAPSKFTAFKAGVKKLLGSKSTSSKTSTASKKSNSSKKMVIVKAAQLYTYNSADWNDKGKIVKKGEAFTIKKELTVKGSKMYQLKSGLYITANTKYVSVK
ncbi:N-acetylmuramoyl-L-alanine amidase [Bacillus subtilis]|uniref:N-acetylmuramoyl-L-alanine amidase n=1 Tax=Bacillus subtilis TaxID=1423 RepID=UPI0011BE982B|nr:N-acetylmuramoyl-L-alanine amidase [Bacillus subtilis]